MNDFYYLLLTLKYCIGFTLFFDIIFFIFVLLFINKTKTGLIEPIKFALSSFLFCFSIVTSTFALLVMNRKLEMLFKFSHYYLNGIILLYFSLFSMFIACFMLFMQIDNKY